MAVGDGERLMIGAKLRKEGKTDREDKRDEQGRSERRKRRKTGNS